MYFVALILTLRTVDTSASFTFEEGHCLCETVIRVLKQSVDVVTPSLIRARVLSSRKSRTMLRISIGEHATPHETPTSLRALLTWSSLQTKHHAYSVESIDLGDPSWSAMATWNDLMQNNISPVFRFSFATPLVLVDQQDDPHRDLSHFPIPLPLFSQLLRHWNTLGGPELPQDIERLIDASKCVVSNYRLRTVVVRRANHAYPGYRGWIEYACRVPHSSAVISLNALARLAFFTGLGAYTEWGMGETLVALHFKEGDDGMVRCQNGLRDV